MLFESLTPPTLVTGQESKHRCPVVLGGVPKLTETQLFQCPESALRPPPTRTSLTPQLGHGQAFNHSAASFCF